MRRITLFIAVFVVGAFAFTNLTFTPATVTMGAKTVVSGNFSAVGDSADILIFLDDNANNVLDAGELTIYDTKEDDEKFVDGGDDMDTVADGLVALELETGESGPFNFPGTYVMIMDDSGPADTAALVVNPGATTNTSVAGTVTGPSGVLKNIMVFVGIDVGDDDWHQITRSGTDGTFLIYLPDSMQGKKAWIGAKDKFDVLAGQALIPSAEVETTVVASITGLNFVFTKATQFINGVVKNEAGVAVGDIGLWFEDRDNNNGFDVDVEADGSFIVPVTPGTWEINIDDWNTSVDYMSPQVKVEIMPSDDTVGVEFVVYTTNATIKGMVIDSAGIDLEDDFGLNVSVDTTGIWDWSDGVWYSKRAQIEDDGSFSIAVNSKFTRYLLSTWADDLPDGYFISPNYIDSVGPGQTGILIYIKKGDKYVNLSVIDETNNPVANVGVELSEQYSDAEVEGQTDINGMALLQVSLGSWQMWVEDPTYMNNQSYFVSVDEEDDTVKVIYMVHSTDATISGTVTGDISSISDKLWVTAKVDNDSLGTTFVGEANVSTRGTFSIKVSSKYTGYSVEIDDYDIPDEYFVIPENYNNEEYIYKNVPVGADTVAFKVLAPKGTISGKFTMTLPTEEYEAGVVVIDSAQGIEEDAWLKVDKTYGMKIPNGTYSVMGGYATKDTTVFFFVNGVVINNNDVVIDFSDNGGIIVPIIFTPVKNNITFNFKNYPNPFRSVTNIAFSTPVNGKATLRIYDLNGRMLKTLYNGSVSKGNYYVQFSTKDFDYQLGAGYYIARIDIKGEKRYTRNIRLINVK